MNRTTPRPAPTTPEARISAASHIYVPVGTTSHYAEISKAEARSLVLMKDLRMIHLDENMILIEGTD
jgi:hypothetical protein